MIRFFLGKFENQFHEFFKGFFQKRLKIGFKGTWKTFFDIPSLMVSTLIRFFLGKFENQFHEFFKGFFQKRLKIGFKGTWKTFFDIPSLMVSTLIRFFLGKFENQFHELKPGCNFFLENRSLMKGRFNWLKILKTDSFLKMNSLKFKIWVLELKFCLYPCFKEVIWNFTKPALMVLHG